MYLGEPYPTNFYNLPVVFSDQHPKDAGYKLLPSICGQCITGNECSDLLRSHGLVTLQEDDTISFSVSLSLSLSVSLSLSSCQLSSDPHHH